MHGSMSKKKNQEENEEDLLNKNTSDPSHINRGVELLLRKRRKKAVPRTFQVRFGNMFSFLNRDVEFYFNFYLDFKKNPRRE